MTKDEIINVACEVCGVDSKDLTLRDEMGKISKNADIVMARHLIAHHLYWRLNIQPTAIAPIVGLKINSIYDPLFANPIRVRVRREPLLRERYNKVHEKLFGTR